MRHVAIVVLLVFLILPGVHWLGTWVGEGQIEQQRQALDSRNLKLIKEEKARIAKDPERRERARKMEEEIARMRGLK